MNDDNQLKVGLQEFRDRCSNDLFNDILPFWIEHGIDHEEGGFQFCLGRKGNVIDTDKGVWQTARFTWLLATLYNEEKQEDRWLELAIHGMDFLQRHCFDTDGRMFFVVDKKGLPVRKRRYVFSEAFTCMAAAARYRATGEEKYSKLAKDLFETFLRYSSSPDLIPAKSFRPAKSIGMPMIGINMAQELRKNLADDQYTQHIDRWIAEIESDFMNQEYMAVMEMVGPAGEFIDHFDGRTLNPGHAIECAWFILEEARLRNNDQDLISLGTKMLDWMWKYGWDKEHGGMLYFVDVLGLPVQEYWHDMKFWWPQCETIIATLMAYLLTDNQKYAAKFEQIRDWTFEHFPDREHGEWYGYLHRDGRISVDLKGNIWKGPFHIPRMYLKCLQILEDTAEL